ncbi:Iron-dependent repressor IdeR [Austwickia sp. TVS 96-490-7B]|uniref:metal-dependent transcriptional regulator n=1 Tax=Austwickia sp. TVS 96-490-7B TaxID=2830843 RepID=UPI001C569C75|nr:metal-dependent transcriptional regulator [Austwickia sp. TVS 96-490-7B]MBW3085543.1 Iron-dependent repressor IdeR [Austwickia sp. TVS 96-490-7B]
MTELIDTTEMYLRIIFELEEEGTPVLRARIVERIGHSGPTVSQTVGRMERDGLLTVQPDRSLLLSQEGRLRATRVMRKHRIAERLLADVIGLEYEFVHAEACRWEHVMSERVEQKILALLEERTHSPYGNPIPGLEELGVRPGRGKNARLMRLIDLDLAQPRQVEIRKIGEFVQDDTEVLALLGAAGVTAGTVVEVLRDEGGWRIGAEEAAVVDADVAAQLWVVEATSVGR